MNKSEFSERLAEKLYGLPENDIAERVSFYNEMIDDCMEDGLSEEDAVAGIGTVDEVVSQIMTEIPLSKLVKEKIRPKHKSEKRKNVLQILGLILGFPVWGSLLIAVLAVILSVYIALWAVVISLCAAVFAIAVAGIACIPGAVYLASQSGNIPAAGCAVGVGLFCVGLSIVSFFGCVKLIKCLCTLTRKMLIGIKSMFIGKGRQNEKDI